MSNTNARQARFWSTIAKESDWVDVLRYSAQDKLFQLRKQLEEFIRSAGDVRTPQVDLARMRLHQIRRYLAG